MSSNRLFFSASSNEIVKIVIRVSPIGPLGTVKSARSVLIFFFEFFVARTRCDGVGEWKIGKARVGEFTIEVANLPAKAATPALDRIILR